ncbi:carbohydrate ABC transporter permease [Pseudonocardia sp. CA-142604]|uniref:carbohydrate ABC transporter permease n=1 Tax=Pseudonocardia sp. CA-142604 TaxID=3240024 RepID=UPI003D8D5697
MLRRGAPRASGGARAEGRAAAVLRARLTLRRRRFLWGVLFVSPWIIGTLGLVLYPMALSLYYSFTSYNIVGTSQWTGLANYQELLQDPEFTQSLENTLYLVVVMVPLSLIASLGYALVLNLAVFGQRFFRTVLYLPQMVPTVAGAILWIWVLNPTYGLVNTVLGWLHITGPLWLNSISWSKPAIVLMNLWGIGGAGVIFLAGLQGISPALVDAARVDGANAWQRFRHVTVPALSPLILFNAIMGFLGAMQYFTQAFIMGGGDTGGTSIGLGNSLQFAVVYLYEVAFSDLRVGYASAIGWVLFVIMLVVIGVLLKLSVRWVFYEGWRQQ